MQNTRVPSVPLITCDPYFSIWSPADKLYDAKTCHWTGREKPISGVVKIDGKEYVFMGRVGSRLHMKQVSLVVTPTASQYRFEGAGVVLDVSFRTPLLLSDLALVSRPCSYIDVAVSSADGAAHDVIVRFDFEETLCCDGAESVPMTGGVHALCGCHAAWMGQCKQAPLSHSGDDVTIDWGYLYVASPMGEVKYKKNDWGSFLTASFAFTDVTSCQSAFLVAAYDDIVSIMYFGDMCKGYWAKDGQTILEAIEAAVCEHGALIARCAAFDAELMRDAAEAGGADYALICALAYRQSIAGHKLIADKDGDIAFISKECFSNGCAATVDVSYPSVPLYLLYAPELVKGMMRPIFKFAQMPVWKFDFAPHDAGRYPYLTGQVYAIDDAVQGIIGRKGVYPMYYTYPVSTEIYDLRWQMPVEECGNMLVMAAAVAKAEGNADFSQPYMDVLQKWVGYLLAYGADPGEQLCTDDFAGHLAHNVNLAAKAIMGIESYSILLGMSGRAAEAAEYHQKARDMAQAWEQKAAWADHMSLVFSADGDSSAERGWSLKYNTVWDILFGSGLFSKAMYENEVAWYLKKQNAFGVPLDSRASYTKSDWIMWAAAMAGNKEDVAALAKPIAAFLAQSPDRVPFSDWFDTVTAKQCSFQNRTVQGGLFMPLLRWKR